jgi:O-antigen ligase
MIFYYLIVLFSAVPKQPWFGAAVGGEGFTVFKYVGLLAFLYSLIYVGIKGKFPVLFNTWQARFFAALTMLAFLSYLILGNKTNIAMSPFMSYLSFLFMFFVTMALIDSSRRLQYSVLGIIGALGIASLYLLREWQKAGFRAGYRAGWVAGDSNYFAANAILALALGFYLFRTRLPRWQKIFCLGCSALTALALLASESRGALIGICVCAVFLFARTRRKLPFALVALLIAPVMFLSPNSPIQRLLHPRYGDINSTAAHEELLFAGFRIFAEHPLFGVGLGRFKETTDEMGLFQKNGGHIAHNVYIEYGAELGVLGLLLFLGIIISTYRSLGKVRREAIKRADELYFAITSGMQTGLVGFCVASLFLSAEYQKTFWVIIFLSACMPALFHKRYSTSPRISKSGSDLNIGTEFSTVEEHESDFAQAIL